MKNNFIQTTHSMPDPEQCKGNDFTINGKCSECGSCCPDCLDISDEEISRIKDYIQKNNIKPCRHIPILQAPGTSIDFLCPFLNINKEKEKCTIYEARPIMCKAYLCSETSMNIVKKRMSKEERKVLAAAVMPNGYRRPRTNLGQTVYRDIYVPKKGDKVVMNKRYYESHIMHANMVFEVMSDPDKDNKVDIQFIGDSDIKYHYDVAGLTKLV